MLKNADPRLRGDGVCGVALAPLRCGVQEYASRIGTSGALHLGIFEQPAIGVEFFGVEACSMYRI